MGGPNHILQHVPSEKPTENPTTQPTPSRGWYGMVWWHYDCQPWLKAFKHFLYRRTRGLSYTRHKQSRERSEERQNLICDIYIVKSLNAHMIGPGQCTVI